MIQAGPFAAAILATKPSGVALATFPLAGLPAPQFANALQHDAIERLYAAWVSLAEALKDIRANHAAWPAVKLYYCCYYSLEAILAAENVVTFHYNGSYYIGDAIAGDIRRTGRSSHQINWNVFGGLTRLTGWVYDTDSGDAYSRMRGFRENASYNQAFPDPGRRQEFYKINTSQLLRTFHMYKSDAALFYTFLGDHIALAYPVRLAWEAAQSVYALGLKFSSEQQTHLRRTSPIKEPFLW